MMHLLVRVTRRSEEHQDEQPEHIKRCESRRDCRHNPEDLAVMFSGPGCAENCILTEEAREAWNSANGQCSCQKRPERPGHLPAQSTHFANVLDSAHSVNHASGSQKEQGFEKSVRHQMEDAGSVSADTAGEKHVTELADGGIGQDLLDVLLYQTD